MEIKKKIAWRRIQGPMELIHREMKEEGIKRLTSLLLLLLLLLLLPLLLLLIVAVAVVVRAPWFPRVRMRSWRRSGARKGSDSISNV